MRKLFLVLVISILLQILGFSILAGAQAAEIPIGLKTTQDGGLMDKFQMMIL